MTKQIETRPDRLPVVEFLTPNGKVCVGGCAHDAPDVGVLVRTFFDAARTSWMQQKESM